MERRRRWLQLAIPRALIGLDGADRAHRLEFKWADHLQREGDAMDFYVHGDVAPEGRLNFIYTIPAAP
ncbi:hypothetical protein [Cohnella sp. REN36]|uniref:hypothetical protein n=1 Tax=Cohnella sp. REN36 TaxID=2887347 RepID=UPI001D156EDA|nr:hypothetical protein [Cohnella sp. REN36]MCC3375335.1 hypothetical protein [Cohnella sp. REN36]